MEPELLTKVCSHAFRHKEDISQYVLREYQKLKGDFVPRNIRKLCSYYDVSQNNEKLLRTITEHRNKMVCINDSNHEIDFEKAKKEINTALEQRLSQKSSYEK